MDPHKLEHFVTVAQEGHFTRAAETLRISQSGLSASVRALEESLGLALFERSTRRVRLTASGRALLPHARRILREMADAQAAAVALRGGEAGSLALGIVQTLTAVDVPAAIDRFHTRRPEVEVTLREDPTLELLAAVEAGELDLAFLALDASPLPDGVAILAEYREALALIAAPGHPLAAAGSARLQDLGAVRFVDFQAGLGLQTVVEGLFREAGVRRRITFRTSEMDQVLALVRRGLGVAMVPDPIAHRSGLARIDVIPSAPTRRLALVARSAEGRGKGSPLPANPAAEAFLDVLHPGR